MADPVSQVMGLAAAPIDVPAANLAEGLGAKTLKAYHGSPHDFDQFSLSKIGTGEGAQAYGHGLYFAEDPIVANTYRGKVSAMQNAGKPTIEGRPINWDNPEEAAAFELWRHNGNREKAARFYEQTFKGTEVPKILRGQETIPKIDPPGKTYEVNLHTSPDELLDWDKPLSQQSPKVQEALGSQFSNIQPAKLGNGKYGLTRIGPDGSGKVIVGIQADTPEEAMSQLTGERAYQLMTSRWDATSKADAAEALRKAGIKGIQYLDQGSRAAGEGTKNFVIFDDKIIEIAKKYGVALPVAAEIFRRQQIGAKNGNVESSVAP
jgi:hypothetical protein